MQLYAVKWLISALRSFILVALLFLQRMKSNVADTRFLYWFNVEQLFNVVYTITINMRDHIRDTITMQIQLKAAAILVQLIKNYKIETNSEFVVMKC